MKILSSKKLLIIDQDTTGGDRLDWTLNPTAYDVRRVSSNPEGLKTAQAYNSDVIILNILQPYANSWILCCRVREFSQAPILVVAAVSDPITVAMWLDAGADDYITRPFSTDMLTAHLQKLTRRMVLIQSSSPISIT